MKAYMTQLILKHTQRLQIAIPSFVIVNPSRSSRTDIERLNITSAKYIGTHYKRSND